MCCPFSAHVSRRELLSTSQPPEVGSPRWITSVGSAHQRTCRPSLRSRSPQTQMVLNPPAPTTRQLLPTLRQILPRKQGTNNQPNCSSTPAHHEKSDNPCPCSSALVQTAEIWIQNCLQNDSPASDGTTPTR
ncbi:hypothetical protein M758_3G019600 [Ceratodon purpureus]|nr:hypothetical protein M758_3G019600 [Ceratodon purpureus]